MLSLKINDIKITMAHLLLRETFDEFLLEESKVVTFGITHRAFTMDKTLDRGWDDAIREWIRTLKISVEV